MQIAYQNIYLQITYPEYVTDSWNSVRKQKAQLRNQWRLEQTLCKEDIWEANAHVMRFFSVFRHQGNAKENHNETVPQMSKKGCNRAWTAAAQESVRQNESSHMTFRSTTWYGHSGNYFSVSYQMTLGSHCWVFTLEERKLIFIPKPGHTCS